MANFAVCKPLPAGAGNCFTLSGVERRIGPIGAAQSGSDALRENAVLKGGCCGRHSCVADCRSSRSWRNGKSGRICSDVSEVKAGGSLDGVCASALVPQFVLLPLRRRGKSRGALGPCKCAQKKHESGGVFVVAPHDEGEGRQGKILHERSLEAKEFESTSKNGDAAAYKVVGDQLDAEQNGGVAGCGKEQSSSKGRRRRRGIYDFPLPLVRGLTMLEDGWEKSRHRKRIWDLLLNPRMMFSPRTRGLVLLNILTFLYGSNVSVIKAAGAAMDPSLFSVGRFAIASLAFTPFLKGSLTERSLRKPGLELGFWASGGYLTQSVSLLTSDASRVSFISAFTVIVVPLFARFSGAKISKTTWISAATGLFGVGLLEANGAPFAIGDLWSFASAIIFGVHISRTEHYSASLSRKDSLPVMALQLLVITVFSALWCSSTFFNSGDAISHLQNVDWPAVWSKAATLPWTAMLYTGLISTAFCLWIELVSLKDVNATEAAVIYTTEQLWGATFAWVTLGERWGLNGWLGAFFIIGGSLSKQLIGPSDSTHSDSENSEHAAQSASLTENSDQWDTDGDGHTAHTGKGVKLIDMRDSTADAASEVVKSK